MGLHCISISFRFAMLGPHKVTESSGTLYEVYIFGASWNVFDKFSMSLVQMFTSECPIRTVVVTVLTRAGKQTRAYSTNRHTFRSEKMKSRGFLWLFLQHNWGWIWGDISLLMETLMGFVHFADPLTSSLGPSSRHFYSSNAFVYLAVLVFFTMSNATS